MKLGNFVRKVSRDGVIEGVKNIQKHYLPKKRLISNTNPLEINCTKAIKKHSDSRISYKISQNNISSYLGASSLAHLLDGWNYIACSFNALLSGDEGACIHLAYYAELRSAMSILATEGIGVFNNKHLGVFSKSSNGEYPMNYYKPVSGGYVQTGSATHQFVWDAMEKWTNSTLKPQADILKVFKVRGFDFYELTEFFHPSATALLSGNIVKKWLKEWCFDIKSYRNDREIRNEVSYRPQKIKNFRDIDFKKIINDLSDYWEILSPSRRDRFSLLDIYLLRKLYNELYNELSPAEPYKELVENALNKLGLHDKILIELLCFEAPYISEHIIFSEASKNETTPLSIIARATLMLRVSVGLVSDLYKSAGVSKSELNFIWDNYGINNGFWRNGQAPPDFEALWTNIQTYIQDLNDWVNHNADNSLYSIKVNNENSLIYFNQINRAGLWGLSL